MQPLTSAYFAFPEVVIRSLSSQWQIPLSSLNYLDASDYVFFPLVLSFCRSLSCDFSTLFAKPVWSRTFDSHLSCPSHQFTYVSITRLSKPTHLCIFAKVLVETGLESQCGLGGDSDGPVMFPSASVQLFKLNSNEVCSLSAPGHLLSVDPAEWSSRELF